MTRTQRRILLILSSLAGLLAVYLVVLLLLRSAPASGGTVRIQTGVFTPIVSPTAIRTPSPTPRPAPQAPAIRTRVVTALLASPEVSGATVIILPGELTLPLRGRTADSRWLLVLYDANAINGERTGWVAAADVDQLGDLQSVPVATAAPRPATSVPPTVSASRSPSPPPSPSPAPSPSATASPPPTPSPSPTPSPTRTVTATSTQPPPPPPTLPPPRGLPDLVLSDFSVIPTGPGAGYLLVQIGNVGGGDLMQQGIEIIGVDQTGAEVLHLTTGPLTIRAGGAQTVTSGYKPVRRTMLTVVLNPNKGIAEADAPAGFDDPNNALTKSVTPP